MPVRQQRAVEGVFQRYCGFVLWCHCLSGKAEDEAKSLRSAGAVGDTNGIFFDQNGKPVDHDLNQRTVAIGLPLLAKTKTIVLSAGQQKLAATQAILRSGVVKGLIIDGDSARSLSDMI